MIIDFRVRPPFGGFLEAAMWARPDRTNRMASALRLPPAPSLLNPSLENTFSEMANSEIHLGIVPARRGCGMLGDVKNDDIAELVKLSNGRLMGFGAPDLMNISKGVSEVSEIAGSPEFAGVVVEPGMWDSPQYGDDKNIYPIYQACVDVGLPLLIMGGGNAGPDPTYTDPKILDHICSDFPNLTVIAVHGGWPWVFQTLHVAFRRENLYLSPDMYLFGMAGWEAYVDAATGYLSDRFLFGTAYPFVGFEKGVEAFKKMFSPDHHDRLMRQNAERVLRIDTKQII